MLGFLCAAFTQACFEVLVSGAVRWAVRKTHLEARHDRALRFLERKRFRRPEDSLSEKQITARKVVKAVDEEVMSEQLKGRLERELGHWGLIRSEWDSTLGTPMTLEWKKFFVRLGTMFTEAVVPSLNEMYDRSNVACFAVLPFPRHKKDCGVESLQGALEECLGSQPVFREFITSGMLDKKIQPQWLKQLKSGEGILVLQPMATNDQYLAHALAYIGDCSMGNIVGIVTLIDASGRSASSRNQTPPERVLVQLSLGQREEESER